jgi:hypothetical protein
VDSQPRAHQELLVLGPAKDKGDADIFARRVADKLGINSIVPARPAEGVVAGTAS